MQQISISYIQRNLHKLNDFDIIEVVDKKSTVDTLFQVQQNLHFLIKEIN